jgi:hypothetical protein
MIPDHVIDVNEAVEYLKQYAWVKDFDKFIEQIMQTKEQDHGNV